MLQTIRKRNRFRIVIPAYPAFNVYSGVANKTTALGPVCVASVVNKMETWDVEVIDENNLRLYGAAGFEGGANHEILQRIRPADVVGFYGGLTSTIPRLYKIAQFYKEKGTITIAGGQHFLDENIEEALGSNIDYVVIGEGEETIKELLIALEQDSDISMIAGIAFRKNGKVITTGSRPPLTDFDKYPLPDFSLVRHAKIRTYPVERIRGCGMDCEFCSVKGKPRCATPARLFEQISFLVETLDARNFFIVDDLFGQQRDETIRLCALLKEYQETIGRKLDFTAQIRLDKAKDPELLSAMRAARINMVAIGFESPIEEELAAMRKNIKVEDMISLTRIFHKFGFLVHGMFIFGYPLKELNNFTMTANERVKRLRNFIRKARIDTVQVLLPVPLPGTELRKRLQEQKRVYPRQDVGWEYYDGNFPLFEPDAPLSAQDMHLSIKKILGKFYQFRYMFMIGLHLFSFPTLIFFLHDIKVAWLRWYRPWRNAIMRFGGWVIMKGWMSDYKKGSFTQKLDRAQQHLKESK